MRQRNSKDRTGWGGGGGAGGGIKKKQKKKTGGTTKGENGRGEKEGGG